MSEPHSAKSPQPSSAEPRTLPTEPAVEKAEKMEKVEKMEKSNFIPFTEAQLATLNSRQQKYFGEARQKISYDLEIAGELDDRVQAAIKSGKRVTVAPDMTGFVCE